jgi:hypothetical protein
LFDRSRVLANSVDTPLVALIVMFDFFLFRCTASDIEFHYAVRPQAPNMAAT